MNCVKCNRPMTTLTLWQTLGSDRHLQRDMCSACFLEVANRKSRTHSVTGVPDEFVLAGRTGMRARYGTSL